MWKSAARKAISTFVRHLPWGARKSLLEAIVEDFGHVEIFNQIGRDLHVTSVYATGDYGSFIGSIDDLTIFGCYMKTGTWAPELKTLFCDFFSQHAGGTFIDIGANIGLTLVPIGQVPGVQCYGFEPEPLNLHYLKRNVATNCPHNNIMIKPIALFDRRTTLQFALSPTNFGDHRIKTSDSDGAYGESERTTIAVEADRLDNILVASDVKLPLVIKIDTQGAEPSIFAGGREILALAEIVALEFWPYGMRRIGGDVGAEIDFIQANFREGSMIKGDSNLEHVWKPIIEVASELRRLSSEPEVATRYFDVIVRK
jgi:FkbM family methyltransferase